MVNQSIPILIKHIQFNGEDLPSVDARDLHKFLEVKRDYSNWIKARIEDYGFEQGKDYVRFSRSPNLASGNRGAGIDYMLTLDMAKELCMLERNEKGRQARRYFIACEKRVLAQYRVDAAQMPLKLAKPTKAPQTAPRAKASNPNVNITQELLRLVRVTEVILHLDSTIALLTRLKSTLPSHVGGETYSDHLTRLIREQNTGAMK